MRSLKRFASNIHNVFTPMGADWFRLTTGHPYMDSQRKIALWLEDATRIIKHHISRPSSNFHSAIYQYYLEAGAFGTGIIFVEDIPGMGPHFRNFPISDSLKSGCRCIFLNSILSPSTSKISPTPADAKYCEDGHPRPPRPMTKTFDFFNLDWPFLPISGSLI